MRLQAPCAINDQPRLKAWLRKWYELVFLVVLPWSRPASRSARVDVPCTANACTHEGSRPLYCSFDWLQYYCGEAPEIVRCCMEQATDAHATCTVAFQVSADCNPCRHVTNLDSCVQGIPFPDVVACLKEVRYHTICAGACWGA
jgi:hypothetical protein